MIKPKRSEGPRMYSPAKVSGGPLSGAEWARPQMHAGMATKIPASGPLAATLSRTRRLVGCERIKITAPMVPKSVGAGIKKGRL